MTDRGALVLLQICPQLNRHVQPNPLVPLGAIWCTSFDLSQLPTHILLTYRDELDFMPSDQWRQHIRDGLVLPIEDLSSPRDDYIRWYWDITRVYIRNPTLRDTRTIGYQPTGVNRRMMEVDDMATGVLEGPQSSPTQYASFVKRVQTIIRRCMVSIGGTLGCTTSQHDIQQTFPMQPSHRRPREPIPERGAR
ncbi:hypothetical protein M9H77_27720 [Catharanthus roseus]|uniref:Uncharacterized protein n=1 Tax=Catharanthus roseus TaxID=4058 RepID=A0ACC0AER2_CATRO|nr:hypothetical protein M9H77_27720 [Catharanthus roseus]